MEFFHRDDDALGAVVTGCHARDPHSRSCQSGVGRPRLRYVLLSFVILTLVGCTGNLASYQIHKKHSYTIDGRNYTFAVYNSENRLITHPLSDLKHEIERRKSAGEKPISDVYVIAHGWNYSGGLAVTSYHNYIELLDRLIATKQVKEEYQPFLIFVTWTSTVHPLSDVANAVLPLNTNEIIRPITKLLDEGPIHLLTAWKQSLNASTIALGRFGPEVYLDHDWNEETYTYEEGWYGERDTGQDLPLSQLVYELINSKIPEVLNPHKSTPIQQAITTCLSTQQNDQHYLPKQALANVKLHLVGHSYGAKLVALAGMEGLRKWVIRRYLNYIRIVTRLREESKRCITDLHVPTVLYPGVYEWQTQYSEWGSSRLMDRLDRPSKLDWIWGSDVSPVLFNERQKQSGSMQSSLFGDQDFSERIIHSLLEANPAFLTHSPIESLVLYSPAIHAGEFAYPISGTGFATSSVLRLIQRKAIIYSRYDRANGLAFNFRDLLMNTQFAQFFQLVVSFADMRMERGENPSKAFRMATAAWNGLQGTVTAIVYASSYYASSLLLHTPADLHHHINNYTFGGAFEPPVKSDLLPGIGKRFLNAADYFFPVWPFVLSRQEDETGIFRLVRPGLGKVGLKRLALGRNEMLSLWNLRNLYGYSRDINAERFCKLSSKILEANPILTDSSGLVYPKDEILSFDASSVYNSWSSLDGSHGDIRSSDPASCNRDSKSELSKRDHSMMFLVNFTTADYMKWLEEN